MTNLVEAKFGKRAPSDLAQTLRELADRVDRDEITEMIAIYVGGEGDYEFMWGASLFNSVGMSAMLHDDALRRMRR